MQTESENNKSENAPNFDVFRQLPELVKNDVELSRGFLRCRPEKWFPSFASHWLPLWHSLGIDARLSEIKPAVRAGKNIGKGYYGVVDGERVAVSLEEGTEEFILAAVSPGVGADAGAILLEYLARRFFASIGLSWSAADNANVQFLREIKTHSFTERGAVKISFSLNNNLCTAWVLLGESLVKRLDGLWRRQLHSQQKPEAVKMHEGRIEFASLEAPAGSSGRSLRKGEFLPLDRAKIDSVSLMIDDKPFLPARLYQVEEKLALQIQGLGGQSTISSGEILRLCSPAFEISSESLTEISQVSSILITDLDLHTMVQIMAGDAKVAEGRIAYSLGSLGVIIS